MDHIAPPTNSHRPHLVTKVPYISPGNLAFDRGSFSKFPVRAGWKTAQSSGGENSTGPDHSSPGLSRKSEEEIATLLQEWCFFGFMWEVFATSGIHIDFEDFKEDIIPSCTTEAVDSGGLSCRPLQLLTTKKLPPYIRRWEVVSRIRDFQDIEKLRAVGIHLSTIFAAVFQFLNDVEDLITKSRGMGNISTNNSTVDGTRLDLMHACCVLCVTTLFAVFSRSLYSGWVTSLPRRPRSVLNPERMFRAGWCISEVSRLLKEGTDEVTLWFLGTMDRWTLGKRHDLGRCSESHCAYDAIDEAEYVTRHYHGCSGCEFVDLGLSGRNLINSIVCKDRIPGITVHMQIDQADPTVLVEPLDVREQNKDRGLFSRFMKTNARPKKYQAYVAISHVWSDGLGNRNANAMPLCQLCRLQSQVNALFDTSHHPVPFWIDTICVPLEQPERNQAIIAMRKIYTEATKVLVVDNVLSEVSSTDSLTDLILRVRASTWMTRLWTYHEARLARSLHYQFRDRPLTVDEMLAQHKEEEGLVCASEDPVVQSRILNLNPLVAYNVDHLTRIQKFTSTVRYNDPHQEDAVALAHVTSHIHWRRTSRPIDEAICLAGVMNRHFDDLVVLDTGPERIKQLVSTLRGVPTDILFIDRPRIEEEGCRWIVSTFLGDEQGMVLMDPARRGTPWKDGLRVSMPCVVLEPGNMGRCENVDVEGGSECIFISQKASRLPNPYPHPNGERTWKVTVLPSLSESITRGPRESPSSRWHILRSTSLVLVLQQSLTDSTLKQVPAVVASVKRVRMPDGLVFCRYEFQANVQLVSRRVERGSITKLKMYPNGKTLCIG